MCSIFFKKPLWHSQKLEPLQTYKALYNYSPADPTKARLQETKIWDMWIFKSAEVKETRTGV